MAWLSRDEPAPVAAGWTWTEASRAERVEIVRSLRRRGLSHKEIGTLLGTKPQTTRNLLNDPDGSKRKAQLKRLAGVCVDCSGPTYGGNGRDRVSIQCKWCAQGKERPRERLSVAVRLCDIPLDVRLDGAAVASRIEQDPDERLELLMAAIEPSERVYWVAEGARPMLDSWSCSEAA